MTKFSIWITILVSVLSALFSMACILTSESPVWLKVIITLIDVSAIFFDGILVGKIRSKNYF